MKTSTTIIALGIALAASTAALAQEATYEYPQPVVSTLTRAEVQAELASARADGTLRSSEADFNRHSDFVSQKTRAQVAAELRDAVAHGETRYLENEGFGFELAPIGAARPAVMAGR